MANYTIIGGDKKEYGPVTAEEVRQWIAEGRLNGQSLIRSDNDTEWRPLATFLEFAPALQPRSPMPPPLSPGAQSWPGADPAAAVKAPAICLIVTTGLNVLLALYDSLKALFFPDNLDKLMAQMPAVDDPQMKELIVSMLHWMTGPAAVVSHGVVLILSAVTLWGATRMLALRSYEFAIVATILAMIPCVTPCCLLGLPFAIWALVVLRKPGVKDHFN
jgi:hypothetical protein